MEYDEYYKYFHADMGQKTDNSFADEFLEDNSIKTGGFYSDRKIHNYGEEIKDEIFDEEPKEQTSDEIGKKLLKDVIDKQLDKEWDMEKLIMKYQLSPEQIDKILYESKAWESEIIGGENENPIFTGGTFHSNDFKNLMDSYLNLFKKSHDFLTRYLRTFQIIAEIEKHGGKDKFLPKDKNTETNVELLSDFLKIIEEIRGSAEVPFAFANIKMNILDLADQLLNTGIQHHNLPLTKFIQSESKEAYKSFVNASAVKPATKHSFINEIYKYDLRNPNRFYTDGIHRNAIAGYVKYKNFIKSTTETLGENFVDVLIHIYNILMKCMEYYEVSKKEHPDLVPPELEKHFSLTSEYLNFLVEVKKFLRDPDLQNVENAKKLVSTNLSAFGFQSSASQNALIVPAVFENEQKKKDSKCMLKLEPNVSGYVNIADFIEEIKPETGEKKEEIKEEKKEEKPKAEEPQIMDEFIEEIKKETKDSPFDIMHMITEPTSVVSLVTPVPIKTEVIPAPPIPPPIPVFKEFKVTAPQKVPIPPVPPLIPAFKEFKVTAPPPIAPNPPVPPAIPAFKSFKVTARPPVAPPPPLIRGFRPLVIPPKPLAKVSIDARGLVMQNELNDVSRGVPVEYRVLPKLSEKKDPYRVKVMFIIAYNVLASAGNVTDVSHVTLGDLAQHANSFSGKTDIFLNDFILNYLREIGFTYASTDALFVYVKYLKNGGVALIDRGDIYNFTKAYDVVLEKLYNLRKV